MPQLAAPAERPPPAPAATVTVTITSSVTSALTYRQLVVFSDVFISRAIFSIFAL